MIAVMDPKTTEKTNANTGARLKLLDLTKVTAEKGVARLIERAIELHASDLFIVTNEQHVAVQVRLRGQVESLCILDSEQGKRYLAHVRHQAGMDVHDYRKPHDGRWIYEADGHSVDLRI